MKQVATMIGSPRIVKGRSVLHPTGDPALDSEAERGLRRQILERALEALTSEASANAA
jgi:glycine reductase complex component B subunit gamma